MENKEEELTTNITTNNTTGELKIDPIDRSVYVNNNLGSWIGINQPDLNVNQVNTLGGAGTISWGGPTVDLAHLLERVEELETRIKELENYERRKLDMGK